LVVNLLLTGWFLQVLEENTWAYFDLLQYDRLDEPFGVVNYFGMPTNEAWAYRYYRQTAVAGEQVLLVKRFKGAEWVVLKPDLSLGILRCTKSRTVTEDPVTGVQWTMMPPVTEDQKKAYLAKAETDLAQNRLSRLPSFDPRAAIQSAVLWQGVAWGSQVVSSMGPFVRYSLRSRRRVLGLVALCYLCYTFVSWTGVYGMLSDHLETMRTSWKKLRTWMEAEFQDLSAWIDWAEGWVEWVRTYTSLRTALTGLLAVVIMIYGYASGDDDTSSRSSTKSNSSAASVSDRTAEARHSDKVLMAENQTMLRDLLESHRAMRDELNDQRTALRAAELAAAARAEGKASGLDSVSANQEAIRDMARRLEGFESMLQQHSGAKAASSQDLAIVLSPGQPSGSASSGLATAGSTTAPMDISPIRSQSQPPMQDSASFTPEKEERKRVVTDGSSVGRMIRRLEDKAMLPQAIFLDQVRQVENVDPEVWNRAFPENYRERMAGEGLCEIYSTGMTAEQWGRQFLRERELLDCFAAREIVAGLSAVDTMVIIDRTPGLLNQVGFERLCRKTFGLIRAFEGCKTVSDWSRPKGKEGSSWKSKVDWDAARRVDPFLKVQDLTIRVPSAEEEIRRGMTQEAEILRARKGLLEAGGGHWDPMKD
jgi:hypothetical protein